MVEDSGGGGEMRSHQFTVSKGKYYVPVQQERRVRRLTGCPISNVAISTDTGILLLMLTPGSVDADFPGMYVLDASNCGLFSHGRIAGLPMNEREQHLMSSASRGMASLFP